MTDADGPESGSPRQISWQEITAAMRAGMAQKVREIPAMCATDIFHLSYACVQAFWLEHHAQMTDRYLENEEAKGPHD